MYYNDYDDQYERVVRFIFGGEQYKEYYREYCSTVDYDIEYGEYMEELFSNSLREIDMPMSLFTSLNSRSRIKVPQNVLCSLYTNIKNYEIRYQPFDIFAAVYEHQNLSVYGFL